MIWVFACGFLALAVIRLAWYSYEVRCELDAYHDVMVDEIDILTRREKLLDRRELDLYRQEQGKS